MAISPLRHLPKEERDEIRRNQIVDAAANCVVTHGFHKATLNLIAEEAHLSVGQIYRYFSSKEKIIEAIVSRLTADYTRWIEETDISPDLVERMLSIIVDFSEEQQNRRALLLEIHAESTRNPVVAEILRESDRRIRERARKGLHAFRPDLDEETVIAIVEFMAALREGGLFRMGKLPREELAGFMTLFRRVAHDFYDKAPDNTNIDKGIS